MGKEILELQERGQDKITAWTVIKSDIIPWILSASLALLLYLGVEAMMRDANPSADSEYISGALYTWGQHFLWALLGLAVFAARRSKSAWSWILTAILIFVFLPQHGGINLAISILPNSVLYPLIAMIGLLAVGRIVEYLYVRYRAGITEPRLSGGAIAVYIVLILGSIALCSSVIYTFI